MKWKLKCPMTILLPIFRLSHKIIKSRFVPVLILIAAAATLLLCLMPIKKSIGFICQSSERDQDGITRCVCTSNDPTLWTTRVTRQLLNDDIGQDTSSLRCVMTVAAKGRLGNLMGEYATLIALSKLNERSPVVIPEMSAGLREYFDLSVPTLADDVFTNIPWTEHEIHDWMLPEYSHFNGTFVQITGYPCSWTFFHHIRDQIKKEFTFKSHFITSAQEQLRKYAGDRKTVTYVGVHVRRGDYVKLMQTLYDGVLADDDFLNQATDYYRKKYPDSIFVVCSDDLDWCRKNTNNSKNDIYFGWDGESKTPGHDMALLTQCNHSIMSIGTFGFWSAYLTGGEVVYLNNYTRPGSEFHKVFHYEAAYLPEWMGIDADLEKTECLSCSKSYASNLPLSNYILIIVHAILHYTLFL